MFGPLAIVRNQPDHFFAGARDRSIPKNFSIASSAFPRSDYVNLIIITGESNSGGYALNSELTAGELLARPAVQILNNDTLTFEDLHIGVNNLIGHTGLSNGVTHGMESGLANSVESGLNWDVNQVYLVKTGQGGSTVSQWGDSDTYMTTFKSRVNAAINYIHSLGKIPIIYVWMSLGINDAIAGTNTTTWKAAMTTWFGDIRRALGSFVPIGMTKFMSYYSSFNTAIDQLVAANPFVYAFSTTDLTDADGDLRDTNHWNSQGMAIVSARMESLLLSSVGQFEHYFSAQAVALAGTIVPGSGGTGGRVATPTFSPTTGNYSETQSVTISCSTPGSTIYYTTDGSTPSTSSTRYTGPISVSSTQIIKAVAVHAGMANSSVGSATYNFGSDLIMTPFTWGDLQHTSDSSSYLTFTSGTPVGGTSIESIDLTKDFTIEIDLGSASSAETEGIVVGLVNLANDNADYVWGNSQSYLAAVYQNSTFNTIVTNSAVLHTGPVVPTYPSKLRMRKSGNDIITSYDFGNTGVFTDEYTITGALTGQTVGEIKVIFAIPGSGQKIKVSSSAFAAQVATPTASPAAGAFNSAQSVTLACATSGATIYYTTDGSTPTTGSTQYTGAIAVNSTTTIKAIAVKSGILDSRILTASFVIDIGFSGSFTNFSWGSLTHTSDAGGGYVAYTSGGTPSGAVASSSIDLTNPFQIEVLFDDLNNTGAIVMYLDDDNTADFAWTGSLAFILGVYQFGGGFYIPVGGYGAPSGGSLNFPTKVRITKSGNDLVVTKSEDNWATAIAVTTATGVLAGKTTGYFKALFAAPSGGQQIKASYRLS